MKQSVVRMEERVMKEYHYISAIVCLDIQDSTAMVSSQLRKASVYSCRPLLIPFFKIESWIFTYITLTCEENKICTVC